jgi:hypothetical protein
LLDSRDSPVLELKCGKQSLIQTVNFDISRITPQLCSNLALLIHPESVPPGMVSRFKNYPKQSESRTE